jgi:hypothetical protein
MYLTGGIWQEGVLPRRRAGQENLGFTVARMEIVGPGGDWWLLVLGSPARVNKAGCKSILAY